VVQGFTTSGITFAPGSGSAATAQLTVLNSTILNNAAGLLVQPTGGIAANAELRWLRIDHNSGEGLRIDSTGSAGAINVALADSSANFNASNGIDAVSGGANVTLSLLHITAASNGSAGIRSAQAGGGTASVTVGNAQIDGNAIGVQTAGGSLLSYGNNQMTNNASNGSFTGTASLQ
jgi:hypothetical protein